MICILSLKKENTKFSSIRSELVGKKNKNSRVGVEPVSPKE